MLRYNLFGFRFQCRRVIPCLIKDHLQLQPEIAQCESKPTKLLELPAEDFRFKYCLREFFVRFDGVWDRHTQPEQHDGSQAASTGTSCKLKVFVNMHIRTRIVCLRVFYLPNLFIISSKILRLETPLTPPPSRLSRLAPEAAEVANAIGGLGGALFQMSFSILPSASSCAFRSGSNKNSQSLAFL